MIEEIKQKSKEEIYIDWQKEFVNGNQFTYFNEFSNEVLTQDRRYYFSSQKVFNLIKRTVDVWDKDYSELLWGQGNIVDQLIPYQQQYNIYMNQIIDMTHRLASPILCVEDGSVDTDELSEEGLAPGKIIIYRQGSSCPSFCMDTVSVEAINCVKDLADSIKQELIDLIQSCELYLMSYGNQRIEESRNVGKE